MKFANLANEMRANSVEEDDIKLIEERCKKYRYSAESMDAELINLGYDKIFTINYEDFEDFDEYPTNEKIYHKYNDDE